MAPSIKLSKHARAFNTALGERIKCEREWMEEPRAFIATELGISEVMVSNIENGRNAPSVFHLEQICKLFSIDVDSMLYEAKESISTLVKT